MQSGLNIAAGVMLRVSDEPLMTKVGLLRTAG